MSRRTKVSQTYILASSVHEKLIDEFHRSVLDPDSHPNLDEVTAFKVSYLRKSFLTKLNNPDPGSASERRNLAISKWRRMELRNRSTNIRIFLRDDTSFGWGVTSERTLTFARETVLRVLGEKPDLEVLYGTFTNGASTSTGRSPVSIAAKFKMGADVTLPCLARFKEIFETCETWKQYRADIPFNIVKGGALFTVPKNSEIDRCAVKEPDLNMFCQKGIGAFIRKRLRQVLGQDLNDQSRNQQLARKGSADGSLATLDLSSASDLISSEMVRALLPEPWYDLLDDCRSQTISIDGSYHDLNMFSSMGNAFTFELESLIFWAISNAVMRQLGLRGTISVYGDDIIVPRSGAGLLSKVLQYFGFIVNDKKSFWSGYFRESCGKHWYKGMDVTPFYVRERISDVARMVHFLNRLRGWSESSRSEGVCLSFTYPFWRKWKRYIPTSLYGGEDINSIEQLVSAHKPRMRLMRRSRRLRPDSLGAYLQWLRIADSREGEILEPIVTSVAMDQSSGFVLRRAASPRNIKHPEWPEEWITMGS